MSAQEMTPEELTAVRVRCATCIDSATADVRHILAHVDALTADRDEARQEVAALRAQRDEIREAHRVEVAALTARLEAAEREHARWGSKAGDDAYILTLEERAKIAESRVRLADAITANNATTAELLTRADAAEAKLAEAMALASKHEAALAHAQVIVADAESRRAAAETARIAAESARDMAARERDAVESVHQSACRKLHRQAAGWKLCEDERNAQKARADAAEKKLAALVEAADALRDRWPEGACLVSPECGACVWCRFDSACAAARGEP